MKIVKISSVLVMLVIILSIFSVPGVALAQDEQPTATSGDTITLSTQYPTINGLATDTFKFDVDMNYTGANYPYLQPENQCAAELEPDDYAPL